MRKIFATTLFLFCTLVALAGIPEGYYSKANGKKKADLKAAMHEIIQARQVLSYGSGATSTWGGFYTTDMRADGAVYDRYTYADPNDPRAPKFTSKGVMVSGMNIEHSFPKSWWGGAKNTAYKDLFNLMPSESGINSSKGNFGMGVVTSVSVNNGCTKVGKGTTSKSGVSLWEPHDNWKGDFARSYMYMATCYSNLCNQFTGEGLNTLEKNVYPTLQPWAYTLYMQWAKDDPVDDIERARNEEIYKIQGNRNPFVDFPELAEYIWGSKMDVIFSTDDTDSEEDPDIPANNNFGGYYDKVEGLKYLDLKSELHELIQPERVYGYGSGTNKTWSAFYITDQMDDGQVRDRYSNLVYSFANETSSVTGMHIEHIWANSWWGHELNNAYKDLFNLYPADGTANIHKNNNPIGVVKEVKWENGVIKLGKAADGNTVWEPADKWKGDFARTYFYMATAYSHMKDMWTTAEGLRTVDPESPLVMRPEVSALMMKWAEQDPCDAIERERNEQIFKLQGNRNPFVDYPNLYTYIWGTSTNDKFYTQTYTQSRLFVPTSEDVMEIWTLPLNQEKDTFIVVRGVNMTDKVSLTSNSTLFGLGTTSLTASQVNAGEKVKLHIGTRSQVDTEGSIVVSVGEETRVLKVIVHTSAKPIPEPEPNPVLSVTPKSLSWTSATSKATDAITVKVFMKNVDEARYTVTVEAPFELSTNGLSWSQSLTTATTSYQVRFGGSETEGVFESDMVVSTKNVDEVIIPLSCIVDDEKGFFENFEQGTKGAYAQATVKCNAAEWIMADALIAADPNKNDGKSVRMKSGGSITMTGDKENGCKDLSFYASLYGSDTDVGVIVEYSLDGGRTWQTAASEPVLGAWQKYTYRLNLQGNVRLRLKGSGTSGKRLNLDDIQMTNYYAEEPAKLIDIVKIIKDYLEGKAIKADVNQKVNSLLRGN